MRNHILLILLVAVGLAGCANSTAELRRIETSSREGVFQEFVSNSPIPKGQTALTVVASLKTHRPGRYLFEKSSHGTSEYKLWLNIDGQAVPLKGRLKEEKLPRTAKRNPDAGTGIRYNFAESILLFPGPHKVTLALPTDEIISEFEITLLEDTQNTLTIEPVYRNVPGKQRPGFYGVTHFLEGIKGLKAYLNGQKVKELDP